jgi:hypothetical protein
MSAERMNIADSIEFYDGDTMVAQVKSSMVPHPGCEDQHSR